MMLDSSGSMSGKPWEQLLDSLREFLTILKSRAPLMNYPKVSIIQYSCSSQVIFREVDPYPELVDQITFTSGGTDFEKPL